MVKLYWTLILELEGTEIFSDLQTRATDIINASEYTITKTEDEANNKITLDYEVIAGELQNVEEIKN